MRLRHRPSSPLPARAMSLAAAAYAPVAAAIFFLAIPTGTTSTSAREVMSQAAAAEHDCGGGRSFHHVPVTGQWSCVMRSSVVRLFPLAPATSPAKTTTPLLDGPELLALLTIRATPIAREVAQILKAEGVILQSPAFRGLRAIGYARIKPNGFHECTPIGSANADTFAVEAARSRGLHLPIFYHSRGHMRERASNGVRCTCGYHSNTGGTGAGLAWQQHLDAVAAAVPFIADAPGIVPGET